LLMIEYTAQTLASFLPVISITILMYIAYKYLIAPLLTLRFYQKQGFIILWWPNFNLYSSQFEQDDIKGDPMFTMKELTHLNSNFKGLVSWYFHLVMVKVCDTKAIKDISISPYYVKLLSP